MSIFFIRALRAFELERQQRLATAQAAQLVAQHETIETQRQARQQTELLNKELQEREKMLANLLHQVVSAQEGERQRIARELHDGTGQILTGLGLGLAAAEESVVSNRDLAARQLNELKRLSSQALEELHNVIRDLRPSVLDDLGLVPALKAQVRQLESRTSVEASFAVEGKRRRISTELETIIFRIGQEALTNVAKHAEAKSVSVRLSFHETCVKLMIHDDGRGFEPQVVLRPVEGQRMAWGLLGIQERVGLVGGVCFIISKPEQGTQIHISVPLDRETIQNVKNKED
jgi:signal transduction histidine kinase